MVIKFPSEVNLFDLREAIIEMEHWMATPCTLECNVLDKEDLKGWRAKPYVPPDEDLEWTNPEWAHYLPATGKVGHHHFLSQEQQEQAHQGILTNTLVMATHTAGISISGQDSTELA